MGNSVNRLKSTFFSLNLLVILLAILQVMLQPTLGSTNKSDSDYVELNDQHGSLAYVWVLVEGSYGVPGSYFDEVTFQGGRGWSGNWEPGGDGYLYLKYRFYYEPTGEVVTRTVRTKGNSISRPAYMAAWAEDRSWWYAMYTGEYIPPGLYTLATRWARIEA